MAKFNFDSFYKQYSENPEQTKLEMVKKAASCLIELVHDNKVTDAELYKGNIPCNEVCELLGWPVLMDNGIFEQCADIAVQLALAVLNYKYELIG